MWENCYYIGGSDGGLLDTPLGPVGAALCWEMIRMATVRRLRSKIDLLLAGSCWWTVPGRGLPLPKKALLGRLNLEMVRQAPVRMALLLGVAAHAGDFECSVPWLPGLRFRSHFLGETQIVNAGGKVLARLPREAGEGVVTAQIRIGRRDPTGCKFYLSGGEVLTHAHGPEPHRGRT
jgi:predicted amidohydrolase